MAIRKRAKVVRVSPEQIELEVCRPTACAGCGARGACRALGGEGAMEQAGEGSGGMGGGGRRITLLNDRAGSGDGGGDGRQGYVPGEEVTLVMRRADGLRAVAIAYLLPVVLVVGLLLLGQHYGVNENTTAGVVLGVVVVYFVGLRLLRRRIGRSLSIEIEKQNAE